MVRIRLSEVPSFNTDSADGEGPKQSCWILLTTRTQNSALGTYVMVRGCVIFSIKTVPNLDAPSI